MVFLQGTLGSGKTVLVKGIARGLSVPEDEEVLSPSYTILRSYMGSIPIHHMDLYRLTRSAEAAELTAMAPEGLLLVEWPERGTGYLPEPTWILEISMLSQHERRIVIARAPCSLSGEEWGGENVESVNL